MEYKPDNPEARLAFRLLWILPIVLVIVLAIALSLDLPLLDFMKQLLPSFVWNFELVKSLPNNCFPTSLPNNANIIEVESCSAIIRNFGLMIGIGLSFMIAVFGLFLALWGRMTQMQQWKTEEKKLDLENKQWELRQKQLEIQDKQQELQQREKLQERFEKASDMLASDAELTRIGACRSLADLGKADESMKVRCVHLLFTFINNPYLEDEERKEYSLLKGVTREENLTGLFPPDKFLRSDIQSAIDSFSAIYEYYGENGVDSEIISLSMYFWMHEYKGKFSLIKANFQGLDLRGAELSRANLQSGNFREVFLYGAGLQFANLQLANLNKANLQKTKLERANLQGADLSQASLHEADMQNANLAEANLHETKFREADLREVNFQGANFHDTDLIDADISEADMRGAKNLTKHQIIEAKWGYNRYGEGGPPRLPEHLEQNENMQKALKDFAYGERKPKDSQ